VSTYLDGRPAPERRLARYLVFGLVVVLALGALTARLFYLQVVNGSQYVALAERSRIVQQPVVAPRGLIYDREGRLLVTNVPTWSVKIRPADLPFSIRPDVVAKLAGLLGKETAEINAVLDGSAGSRFDLVRIARDVPEATARLISESRRDLPGVEVVVEARRQYTEGPLLAHILGYTGPVSPDQLPRLKPRGYLADDLLGKAGVELVYEEHLRGTYGAESVERDAAGRKLRVLQMTRQARPGDSLKLTIDMHEQQLAEKAMRWAMEESGVTRGVVIVMNPQTGEILAMVSLPSYDNNLFARGISNAAYAKLLEDPDKPLVNHAVNAHYSPGSTYKLVAGAGGLADRKITPGTRLQTAAYLTLGSTKFYEWNKRGWGACDLDCGFGHSSDTYFFQVAGMLGIDRLSHWAHEFGFGDRTGIDLPGEVAGVIPSQQWKQDTMGLPIYPGEVYQAGIGQGYVSVTPLQLINAYAALANGGTVYEPQVVREIVGPDGETVRSFEPRIAHQMDLPEAVLREMREASRSVVTIRHTYNLVDLPIVVSGKSGTSEFGVRDAQGRLPFSSWFVGFVPKDPYKQPDDPTGMKAAAGTDSELAVLAFVHDSRTKGNAGTEVAKYYLQLHYGIEKDYRNFHLMKRGNFYASEQ
jgi:penicillin-binding protein 2